jgi:hypothetical protein
MSKSVARELATAAPWVRIQTSFKNHKCAPQAKEWPTHSSPPKKCTKKTYEGKWWGWSPWVSLYVLFLDADMVLTCPVLIR